MPLNLNNLAGKTATAEVQFLGQTAKLVYDPTFITKNTLTEATTKSDDAFMVMFTKLVKSWDVTSGNGKSARKVPLTTAALADVPLVFLRACFQTIMAEAGQGSATDQGKASSGS